MRWKVFFGLSLACLSVLFLTQSSFAASQSIEFTPSNPGLGQVWSAANNYNGLTFTPSYVLVEIQLPAAELYDNVKSVKVAPRPFSSFNTDYCAPDSSGYCSMLLSIAWGVGFESPNNGNYTYSRFTFYDYNPASSEPCPECPEVPELPYGEKLDHLTAAIIFVPATMLVIYFMFAIYSMFFRGLK